MEEILNTALDGTPSRELRLACCDHSFPALPHDLAVDLIARLGFVGCDVMLNANRSHVQPEDVRKDVVGWASRLDERIRGRGLDVSDLFLIPGADFTTMAPNHPDGAERERGRQLFREVLDFAACLRAPGITMLPGVDWPHETHDESLARAAEELGQRVAEARDRGVVLSIEPHVGSVCRTPADTVRLCELAPGLQLTLDYTHWVSAGFAETDADPLLALTRHFHARGGAEGRLQAPLKDNTINYERIVDAMTVIGYQGYLAVEYVWVEQDGLNGVDIASETVMMRDRLRAKLDGQHWVNPVAA